MTKEAGSFWLRNRYLVHVFARPRLLASVLIGILAYALMPTLWHLSTRILLAWNLGTWLYIGLATWMMTTATATTIRRHAVRTDESRFIVLTLAIVAAIASLAAIFAQLGAVKDAQGYLKALHLGLAIATIFSAWSFIHLIFAQHYAHEFFVEREAERALPEDARGGLRFPATRQPAYIDFLYYSFVIGCASQTADVETTSGPMRVVTLIHGVISFFFNTTILALTINIGSGLI
ncbi:Uncharacterized membrane protein [Rhizobiales bacterium GAS191]|jgi:uncharacterized membrane protein|nr:Uncharacterized membrane protein [Rhizobiales bacterium GAS113]SEC60970.1 Uncharacterized membrane protein [Rhizobiales bacterium GAS188]SEC67628.1 Uncharacterized membrane protein [Rhizobiales bacterium GAS191]